MTLVYQAGAELTSAEKRRLRKVNAEVIEDTLGNLYITGGSRPSIRLSNGENLQFDVIYRCWARAPDPNWRFSLAHAVIERGS